MCSYQIVKNSEITLGTRYSFNLVLEHKTNVPDTTFYCEFDNGKEEACHMEVFDVPWEQERTIQWDNRSCQRSTPNNLPEE